MEKTNIVMSHSNHTPLFTSLSAALNIRELVANLKGRLVSHIWMLLIEEKRALHECILKVSAYLSGKRHN